MLSNLKPMIKNLSILVLLLLILTNCSNDKEDVKVFDRDEKNSLYSVSSEDVLMNSAIDQARRSVNQFISNLQNPKEEQTYFSIKAKFSSEDEIEHIWLSDVQYIDGIFIGKIGNEPEYVNNISFGEETSVYPNEISDWMIIENNILLGGYTIKAIRNSMSDTEKIEFDKSISFKIE